MVSVFLKRIPSGLVLFALLLFSFWLMFHEFSADASHLSIATKSWSDFGSHIPLIRSFSMGDNFANLIYGKPIQHPLFPNEPIRYHFLFYALVGILEKAGLRIDWAFNIPSALGLFFLMVMMWKLAYELFADTRVAALSVIFFLFNGSLSFLTFFKTHPLSLATPIDIITNAKFPSFGPWDGGDISAFWTLNIYTNQRHLGLSFALSLFVFFLILRKKYGVLPGIILGLLLFTNQAAAGITALFLVWFFIARGGVPFRSIVTALAALPFFLLLTRLTTLPTAIAWLPGYLTPAPLTILSFLKFWFLNLGLHTIFIPLGLLLAPRRVTKLLLVPLFLLFILPNLFRFSPDMINNHKFFNFFLIIGNMFSAYAVLQIMNGAGRHAFSSTVMRNLLTAIRRRTNQTDYPYPDPIQKPQACLTDAQQNVCRTATLFIIFFLTLSGVIDFFPILNDTKGSVLDVRANPDAQFFATQTLPDAVVANSTWFYHPASLAGRAIFNGYSYFTWSYGYDQGAREKLLIKIYQAKNRIEACQLLLQHNIAYVELSTKPEGYLTPNRQLWRPLPKRYENQASGLSVYAAEEICQTKEKENKIYSE